MMRFRSAKIFFLYLFIFLLIFPPLCLSKQKRGLTAQSAIVIDKDKGEILYKKNPHQRLPVASTVKVLTAIIATERLDLERRVAISKRAAGIAPSKAYLSYSQRYKVKDLLKALLMSSANDAGVALAEAVSKTEVNFSYLMNRQAKNLGAKDSFFLNATGLPESKKRQYSTAHNLSIFMRKALRYPDLVQIMQTKNATISGDDAKKIFLRNHNKFLWRKSYDLIGKTGYTRKAKHCFLGAFKKGKRQYVVAILGSSSPWSDLEYLINRKY